MDKQQAKRIIQETFEQPFDKERFIRFVKDLVNHIEEAPFIYRGNYIPDAFEQHITSLERIGKYSASEYKLDILVVHLKKEASIERARTMQRNFVAWYLNGSRGGELKDAALVAYVSPDKADWRFSLVKMDYRFDEKGKVKQDFTPARRWSFLVGANEKSHTAQSRLVNILANDEQSPTLTELEESFNIETVTKEFFIKYRDLFIRTKEELDKVVNRDPKVKADFEKKGVDTVNFAKKLLGQIVFLYFLQKKGWFGVGRDAHWGTGSKQFLRELFEEKHGTYRNFFNDILEPLFYEALRIGEERRQDDYYYSRFNCKIPFLNGGLFDPIGNYDWVHTDINLPDSLFSNSAKTKEGDTGDGILDVFDRYNFTVKEDEPLEKEVAIDPELLGKAYEKFNAIRPDNFGEYKKALKSGKKGEESKFNKQYGVYYTPREIVHYMCQQSLINYLYSELNSGPVSYEKLGNSQLEMLGNKGKRGQIDLTIEHKSKPTISKEDIEILIHYGEHVSENEEIALIKEQKIIEGQQKTSDYKLKLPESIRNNAEQIDQQLADLTVCDPAVGSGAFPVGMMSEIVKARNVLTTFLSLRGAEATKQSHDRTPYDFKHQCIEHSLYGVDIDPGAVEIAKLRLWLSLVVDEDDIKNIKPLPNLDYRIVCGNSLLGVEKNLFNAQLFSELEKLKPLYFNETNPTKKQEHKKQIDDLITQLTNGHKEFDFEVYFSEVFHQEGGFDVVIGNPPYGFHQIHKDDKKIYFKKHYVVVHGSYEHYFLFYESSLKLLNSNGSHAFIAPVTWLTIPSAHYLRQFILTNFYLVEICWFTEEVFEKVSVNTLLSFIQKRATQYTRVKVYAEMRDFPGEPKVTQKLSQIKFKENNFYIGIFGTDKDHLIINKMKRVGTPLSTFAHPCSGYNPYEVGSGISPEGGPQTEVTVQKKPYHATKKLGKEWKPEITGRDLGRYRVNVSGTRWVKYGHWLAAPRAPANFQGKRILVQEITGGQDKRIVAAYYENELYYSRDVIPIKLQSETLHPFYLLALVNSWLMSWFHQKCNPKAQKALFPKVLVSDLKKLPVRKSTSDEQKPIIKLVNQILAAKHADPTADTSTLERQIDQLVYQLYGLTPEEIKIVEVKDENTH